MSRHKHKPPVERSDAIIKKKHASCPGCRGRLYAIPAGVTCQCGRRRNTNVCPGCGGLPERVEGTRCLYCGTAAGKNLEYVPQRSLTGSVKMDVY